MLKISLITVCYNSQATILDTLNSVMEQDYPCIEYILVDGQSTDGTLELVEPYLGRISHFISEPDNGIYDAINKGIRLATGDVLGLLHADDTFGATTILSKIAQTFEHSQADCVYGDLVYVSRDHPDQVVRYWKSGLYQPSRLRFGWMPPHPTFYTKRVNFEKYGLYDPTYKIAADYDLMLRFLGRFSLQAAYLPIVIVKMKTGGVSNRSIKHLITKSKEDLKALRSNKIGNIYSLIFKNISKISQFIFRE